MTFLKVSLTSIIALFATVSTACTANSAEQKSNFVKSSSYLKPGAAVNYSHNLKSQLSAGTTTTFELNFGDSYSDGTLDVSLSTEGDISLFTTSTQASFDMSSGTPHAMNVSLTANSNGRHYINVVAMAKDGSGQSLPRIFSIPVQVGPETAQKPNPLMRTTESGQNIIEMTAEEVIK